MKREKLRTVGVSKHSDGSGNYDTIAYFHKWTEISIFPSDHGERYSVPKAIIELEDGKIELYSPNRLKFLN